ncbi:hypothetical protein BG015_009706 [Linnemannia schmuckeri]|uniref:Uncharacterized protein n=1 Tax=Linnemannia schmuckeri TaxID=64567 RepID=A0A9P5RVK7_9FUNG|nr:hypothetical protein BG015_009706 [Linnemannia schmuckeri]
MVGKLFNDLVTALDILPESSTVDICINHPSPAVLAGKVRVIAKRPCVYKSLVLTVTGTSRVWMRQGAKTIKAKQVFLKSSKKIVFEGQGSNVGVGAIGDGGAGGREQQQQQQQRQQQRASSLSSMTSLSNSHPSNIPVSPVSQTEEEAFPSTSPISTAAAPAAGVGTGVMTRMSRMMTTTTTATTTTMLQGAVSAQQPVRSSEPSHGFSMSNNAADDDNSSPMTHLGPLDEIGLSTPPADNSNSNNNTVNNSQQPTPPSLNSSHNRDNSNSSNYYYGSGTTTNSHLQNQLRQGVNDIDFYLEFPSHVNNPDTNNNNNNNNNTAASDSSRCLPSGPFKSFSGDSTIVYTLSATLVMSRRDILVNNQMTTSIPFRVQCWQDIVDWRNHSEDHSYHGKRRGKIEFRLEVPKQLDMRRLQDLQFGFEARWKTLQDRLKIKEVHYSIIEEETQILGPRMAPNIHTTVISTAVTHDCAGDTTPTNSWTHMRGAARLQIPQPLTVMESMSTPWPHTLSVSHKLRVVFRFDQSLNKERDLQLSFPILIHPTLNAAGGPVHTHALFRHLLRLHPQSQSRRRARRALFGMVGSAGEGQPDGITADCEDLSDYDEDMDYDDDEDGNGEAGGGEGGVNGIGGGSGNNSNGNRHLPVYADREGTLLLMVGHEIVQETTDLLPPEQADALGISIVRTSTATNPGYYYSGVDRRSSLLYSSSEASMSSAPNSPTSPTTFMEQYSWGSAYDGAAGGGLSSSPTSTTTYSMYSTSPDFAVTPSSPLEAAAAAGRGSIVSRRHSSYTTSSGTPVATMELSLPPPYVFPSVAEGEEDYMIPPPSPLPFRNDTQELVTASETVISSQVVDKGKDRSDDDDDDDVSMVDVGVTVQDVGPSSSSSAAVARSGTSTVMPSFGLPSPEYEIQESPLQSCAHKDKDKGKKKDQGGDVQASTGNM